MIWLKKSNKGIVWWYKNWYFLIELCFFKLFSEYYNIENRFIRIFNLLISMDKEVMVLIILKSFY